MEGVIRGSGHGGVVKEEWRSVDSDRRSVDPGGGDEGGCKEVVVAKVGSSRKSSPPEQEGLSLTNKVSIEENRFTMEPDPKAPSSRQMERNAQLESARAEMGEAREENQRLKMYLNHIKKDYKALQMQIYEIIQREETKKSTDTAANTHQACEEHDLVSLSLGFARDPKRDTATGNVKSSGQGADDEQIKKGLSLGLDCKFDLPKSDIREKQSQVNSLEEAKGESSETWQPSNALKATRNGDEALEQNTVKKARVSVRARCDTPTMNDGCQWRKYGQKISKGNPCPRAYYRCTLGPSCPVRKQVQRCADDMSILIATYEGTHNHPLPVSATAMASTTSAAASMLLSGSSSSSSPLTGPNASANTTSSALHGLKCYLSDNSKSPIKPFFIQNPSLASSPSYPTITLDLTSNPPTSSSHFNRFSSSYLPVPRFPSSSLSFGSSESSAVPWAPWGNAFPGYGSTSQHYNRNHLGTLNLGQSVDSTIYQSYMQKNPPQPSPPDNIAAATKAITADPSFQSALAAALASLIGSGSGSGSTAGGGGGGSANLGSGGDNFAQKLKWDDHFPVVNSYLASPQGTACASSYINKTTSTSSQPGSLVFLPPSLPFSVPKGASTSPGNNRDRAS